MATSSLDVCMYIITNRVLSETIVRLHRKGVNVRVIADADMADGSGTQIPILRKYGKEKLQMFFWHFEHIYRREYRRKMCPHVYTVVHRTLLSG